MLNELGRGVEEEEMGSECSSGCQSGWTIYLVHSSDEQSSLSHKLGGCFQTEEEEEDLSMISDASSWPPHLDGTGYCCIFSAPVPTDGGKKGRAAAEQPWQHAVLEDTASSQLFRNTNKNNFSDYDHQSKRPMKNSWILLVIYLPPNQKQSQADLNKTS